MKLRSYLALSIAVLAQAPARAADMKLEIAPPEVEWLLPPLSLEPCNGFGVRYEACQLQVLPEGMPTLGEQALMFDLQSLLAAGDYEAALARIGLNYGPELLLLEAGDHEGFLATRMPTDGSAPTPVSSDFQSVTRALPTGRFQAARAGVNAPAITDGAEISSRPVPRGPAGNTVITGHVPEQPDYISASVLYVIGHSYLSLERYVPAETAFRLALVPLPNHIRAHESLGLLYLRTERYAEAREHLARALQLGRNTAHVHAALGYLDQKARHYWSAASAFQEVLVLAPDSGDAKLGLLNALTETREHEKAKALVEELLQSEPDDPRLWLYRAQVALEARNRAAAVASLEVALRLGDDSAANRATCAALHLENGNIARAVELLRGSAARGLTYPVVDQLLGWLANEGRWDELRELATSVDRAALGGAEQSRLLTWRASLAARDGNRRAAGTALEEALALDPANADALTALAQLYRAARDYGLADLLLERASTDATAREAALVARADVAFDQEDYDGAIAHLSDAITLNPARDDLRRNIGVLENIALLRTQR